MLFQYTPLIFLIISNFAAISSAEFTEEEKALMNNLHSECVGQTSVAEDLIEKARQGNFVDDNSLKCYMKCVFDEVGVIDDNGQLDIDGMIVMLPDEMKEDGTKAFKTCGTQPGSDLCDSIFQTHKCLYEQSPATYFLP